MVTAIDFLHLTEGTFFRLILSGIHSRSNASGFNWRRASAGALTGAENEAGKLAKVSETGVDKISEQRRD